MYYITFIKAEDICTYVVVYCKGFDLGEISNIHWKTFQILCCVHMVKVNSKLQNEIFTIK